MLKFIFTIIGSVSWAVLLLRAVAYSLPSPLLLSSRDDIAAAFLSAIELILPINL
jgi:hypothetical protein